MVIAYWTIPPGRAAILFPLAGAMLGAAGAALYVASSHVLPGPAAALLTVAFWTGVPGRPFSRMPKGRRVFGVVAMVLSVAVRWQALEHLATPRLLELCIAAQAVPRAATVALAWVSRPAATALDLAFSSTLTTAVALAAIAQGAAAAMACGLRPGLLIAAASYLTIRAARWYCYRRIGGVNGAGLRAAGRLLEIVVLLLLSLPWNSANRGFR
jgi:adenosylcobinamide-GDP ribazoletransferase